MVVSIWFYSFLVLLWMPYQIINTRVHVYSISYKFYVFSVKQYYCSTKLIELLCEKLFCVGKYISDVTTNRYNANHYELQFVIRTLDSFEKLVNLEICYKTWNNIEKFYDSNYNTWIFRRIMTSVYMLKIIDNILFNKDFLFACSTLSFHFNKLQGQLLLQHYVQHYATAIRYYAILLRLSTF